MAAAKTAPGTTTSRGVNSTMGNAMKASTGEASNGMTGPFSKPHSMGGGAIPVKVYDTGLGKVSVPKPSQEGPLGAEGGQKRPGTK